MADIKLTTLNPPKYVLSNLRQKYQASIECSANANIVLNKFAWFFHSNTFVFIISNASSQMDFTSITQMPEIIEFVKADLEQRSVVFVLVEKQNKHKCKSRMIRNFTKYLYKISILFFISNIHRWKWDCNSTDAGLSRWRRSKDSFCDDLG